MDNSEQNSSFSKEWQASNPAEKLGLLDRIKKSFESKDFTLFSEMATRYGDFLDHDNPNIAHAGLELFELQVKEVGWNEELRTMSIISTLLTQTLQRKERKAQAIQLLLLLAETQLPSLQSAIEVNLRSKFPKQLLEILRFLQLMVIKTDENKKLMLKELSPMICSIAAEFSLASVRQAALDLIIKISIDLGVDFIRPNLPLLKKTQRVQIAKRLNEKGIADEDIDAFEQKKAFCLKDQKLYQEIQEFYYQEGQKQKPISFKTSSEMESLNHQENTDFYKGVFLLSKKEERILFFKNISLFVDKLKEAMGKEKIYIIAEIRDAFVKTPEQIEDSQLMQYWEFAKYLSFSNPQAQLQIMEIISKYMRLMDTTPEKKEQLLLVLKGQTRKIFTQIIRNLAASQRNLLEKSKELVIYFLNDTRWREDVLDAFSRSLLSKSEGTLLSSLKLLNITLLTNEVDRNVLSLPMAKQILEQVVSLVSTACEGVRRLAFSTMVAAAALLGLDVFIFADKMPKAQFVKFQQQTASLLKVDNNDNKINEEQQQPEKLEEDEIVSNQLKQRIESLKLRICHGNIANQDALIMELTGYLDEEKKILQTETETVKILRGLIEGASENIAINSAKLCGLLSGQFTDTDRLLVFKSIFNSSQVLRQKETIKNLTNLMKNIDKSVIFPYLLNQITERATEDTAFAFLTNVLDTLDEEQTQVLGIQAVKLVITDSPLTTKVLATDFLAKTWLLKGKEIVEKSVNQLVQETKQSDMLMSKIEKSYKKYLFIDTMKKNQASASDEIKAEMQGIKQKKIEESQPRPSNKPTMSFKDFRKNQMEKQKGQPHQGVAFQEVKETVKEGEGLEEEKKENARLNDNKKKDKLEEEEFKSNEDSLHKDHDEI